MSRIGVPHRLAPVAIAATLAIAGLTLLDADPKVATELAGFETCDAEGGRLARSHEIWCLDGGWAGGLVPELPGYRPTICPADLESVTGEFTTGNLDARGRLKLTATAFDDSGAELFSLVDREPVRDGMASVSFARDAVPEWLAAGDPAAWRLAFRLPKKLRRLGAGQCAAFVGFASSQPLPDVAGVWRGTWTDTRFGVGGDVRGTITRQGAKVTGSGVLDLASLGLGDVTGTAEGTIAGGRLEFTFKSGPVGSGSGALTGASGRGSGTVGGALGFGGFTFEGTVTDSAIEGTFRFVSPSGGRGVASLTKQ